MSQAKAQTVGYSTIAGPYSSFNASTGLLGFDDYTVAFAGPTFSLTSFQFVGGVTTANTGLNFSFRDSSGTVVSSLTSTFTMAGNFIYTITPTAPIVLPTIGQLYISTSGANTGQYFLTATAPSVGSNSTTFGQGPATGNPTFYQAFALSGNAIAAAAPEPGSLPLLGMGLVSGAGTLGMAARRRRKATVQA